MTNEHLSDRKDPFNIEKPYDLSQRLADRSLDAIYRFDGNNKRYIFVNRRFMELFDIEPNHFQSNLEDTVFKQIHPEDRELLHDKIQKAMDTAIDEGEANYRMVEANGNIRWLNDRWVAHSNGADFTIEGFIRDVTEERLALQAFLDSKQNAPIGTFIVQDDKFKYVNTEFIRITGYSKDELIGSNPFTLIHEDYREYVQQQAVAMLKRASTTPYEFCVLNKKGQIRWIMETVTPIYYGGRRAALGYFMDVSRLHTMQLNLSTLGLMIGTVSHSLKGCLTGLDASLYLIESGFYRNKPARIEEGLDVTKLMVDRIRKLVLDVLYYAKERDLQLTTVDVWQFAEDISTSMETRIRAANIDFKYHFPPELGKITIDTELIRPALINILENAMEACIEDTTNKAQEITFDVQGEADQVIFKITDNGPGIADEAVSNIFRLFYSSKGHKGTGIGLFITRKVIHKHGGQISVKTEVGKGACFTVILPRQPTATVVEPVGPVPNGMSREQ